MRNTEDVRAQFMNFRVYHKRGSIQQTTWTRFVVDVRFVVNEKKIGWLNELEVQALCKKAIE